MNPDEALKLARTALHACQAESVEVSATGSHVGQIRWANNAATTAGSVERATVTVTASFGMRSASASTEDVTPEGLTRVARTAADLARLTPPNPEHIGPVKPQLYPKTFGWDAVTAATSPESRAAKAAAALGVAKDAGLLSAGYLEESDQITVVVNSLGNSGTWKRSLSDFSTTMRTPDGKQSGWAGASAVKTAEVDAAALSRRAATKAVNWKDPIELAPGRYTAVLEPAATAPLMEYFFDALDRRSADEGQSVFAKAGGGNHIGDSLFADSVSVVSDPGDRRVPGSPWGEGQASASKLTVVDHGKLAALDISRSWAKQKKLVATPNAGNFVLSVDKPAKDLDAVMAGIEKGVLVTRIWYVRMLAPQTLTVTGVTRDATFLIEDGRVTSPIKNFRLNQSVVDLLKNIEAAGPVELWGGFGVPALRVKDFGFSSLSDAV